ncbi:NADPH:quinone oxidoreductase family protein [Streptomyces sp. NPDC047042]|uniref:NADPH:quinone oxidoreductase family protein n=1 Tax=Streptomyces sp. NPDC047042 TaxID=3154807 RepID=UPI0033F78B6C
MIRALMVGAFDDHAAITVAERMIPAPSPSRPVLVDVTAAALGFPDALVARGLYQLKPHLPFVPGMEVYGTVRSAPDDSSWSEGQAVVALTGAYGGCAEVVAVPEAWVYPAPAGLEPTAAAASIVNFHTAYFALVRRARLQRGERVIVHGACGGLGNAAAQLALALGAEVVSVGRGDGPPANWPPTGGRHTWISRADDWPERVRAAVGRTGGDVIIDPVGGAQTRENLRLLAPEGRLISVGFASGEIPEVAFNRLLLRNITVAGAAWREFVTENDPSYGLEIAHRLDPLFQDGSLRSLPSATCTLAQAPDALRDLIEGTRRGRVVVMCGAA